MSETHVTMGKRPDGSPWVIHVDFGAKVSVDAYGQIVEQGTGVDPEDARARAAALLAAAEWVESGKSGEIEARRT